MVTNIQLGNIFTENGRTRVSGGASGFDIQGLVEGLTEARRFPAVIIEERLEENSAKISAYNELRSLISDFRDAANFLRSPPGVNNESENIFEYRAATLSSSDGLSGESHLNVTAEPGTPIGEYSITIDQIATRNVKTTETFSAEDIDSSIVGGGGPLRSGILTLGPFETEIELENGDSISQVIAKINAKSDESKVEASYIKVDDGQYRLSFKTTETGTDYNYDIAGNEPYTADDDGFITFEAEGFHQSNVAPSGLEWERVDDNSALGGQVVAVDDNGDFVSTTPAQSPNFAANSPRLDYDVQFDAPGTYYIWMHMAAGTEGGVSASDSVVVGIDGVPAARESGGNGTTDPAVSLNGDSETLIWTNDVSDTTEPLKVEVTSAGVHQINLFMREDGARIDRFVITDDASYVPTGTGPAVSPRNSSIFNIGFAVENDAVDAQMTIDGTQITRSSNDFNDVIDGLTFNLNEETVIGEEITLEVEPDRELAKQGILNFVDSYNAVKLYASGQTEIGDDGEPVETATLSSDSTLSLIMGRISNELSQEVGGIIDGNFARLADIGITFSDFPGDEETPFTRNILTLDEDRLDTALSTSYDEVRDVFEFDYTADNSDFQIFARGNGLGVSEFSVSTYTEDSELKARATYTLAGETKVVDLDTDVLNDGTLTINGQDGTALQDMVFLYSNPVSDSTINLNVTQGIGDRLFNTLDQLLIENEGALDVTISSLEDDEDRFIDEIASIDERIERYRETLISQFSALEAAISQANTLLQSLDANANARNNG